MKKTLALASSSDNLFAMDTSELDYDLPLRLIAQHPLAERAMTRLLVLNRRTCQTEHQHFCDLPGYLTPGDCLVLNDTRVFPARFFIRRSTGGRIEGLFINLTPQGDWQVLLKNASRLRPNEEVVLITPAADAANKSSFPRLKVRENQGAGRWLLQPGFTENFLDILWRFGLTPLPPYIHRPPEEIPANDSEDRARYQTVYARPPGSIAAPTAGLHFTNELLEGIREKGVHIARLTLHVGLGTFKPITAEKVEDHVMHPEYYQLDEANAELINQTISQGGRIFAVGTTSVRTLESLAEGKKVRPGTGWTDLFITPGYEFQIVDALITNFHLPRTSLLALVCAFAGTQTLLAAYRRAIELEYRFYSYGDAMLIL